MPATHQHKEHSDGCVQCVMTIVEASKISIWLEIDLRLVALVLPAFGMIIQAFSRRASRKTMMDTLCLFLFVNKIFEEVQCSVAPIE